MSAALRCVLPYADLADVPSLARVCRGVWMGDRWRQLSHPLLRLLAVYARSLHCAAPCAECAAALDADLRCLLFYWEQSGARAQGLLAAWRATRGQFDALLAATAQPDRLAEWQLLAPLRWRGASAAAAGALLALARQQPSHRFARDLALLAAPWDDRQRRRAVKTLIECQGDLIGAIIAMQ
jgi:hypothetical protein